jgi:hypothetical protein
MSDSPEGNRPGPDETERHDEEDEIDWFGPKSELGTPYVDDETEFANIIREEERAKYEAFMKDLREQEAREAVEQASPDVPDEVEPDTERGEDS